MGMFFNLYVETGKNPADFEAMMDYFQTIRTMTSTLGIHQLHVYPNHKRTGIVVAVPETGHTGLFDNPSKEIATIVGHQFYQLLLQAPRFHCAMVGLEAGDWFDDQSILDPDFDGYLPDHGLVLNKDLNLNIAGNFVDFKDGYAWIPYEGEGLDSFSINF